MNSTTNTKHQYHLHAACAPSTITFTTATAPCFHFFVRRWKARAGIFTQTSGLDVGDLTRRALCCAVLRCIFRPFRRATHIYGEEAFVAQAAE